jgi:hypothetical protein
MRWLALLLGALLACAGASAQAGEIPKRKPGLWELHWHSNDVTPEQAATVMASDSAKMCIDASTDAKLAASYDPCDTPLFFALYSPQFTKEVVCEAPVGDDKAVSNSTVTFTGDAAYRIDVRSRFLSAPKGKGDFSGYREGKWVGACPSDMHPGDLIIGDEPKENVLDKLKNHDE